MNNNIPALIRNDNDDNSKKDSMNIMKYKQQIEEKDLVLNYIAEWFDPRPQITKTYLLKFYVHSQEAEMREISTGRKFLKRTRLVPSYSSNSTNRSKEKKWTKEDFYMGETTSILLFSRDLKLVDYADEFTRSYLQQDTERTVLIIPPSNFCNLGSVIQSIENMMHPFTLVDCKAFMVDPHVAEDTATILRLENPDELLMKKDGSMKISNRVQEEKEEERRPLTVALAFRGKNCIQEIHNHFSSSPSNGQGNHHRGGTVGVITASTSEEAEAFRELFLENSIHEPTAIYNDQSCCCCIIKPHILKEDKKVGEILQELVHERGFQITAMQMFYLERSMAAEFYEVYNYSGKELKTTHYNAMVDELCSGPILVMELYHPNNDTAMSISEVFRSHHVGPCDVGIAQRIQPSTLRAKYGQVGHGRTHNAVHCTDLPEESILETAYFFDILLSNQRKLHAKHLQNKKNTP